MAITNIIQWNPTQANQESDSDYSADSTRSGGAVNQIFQPQLANKLFYQLSTVLTALAQAMVAKGYNFSDTNLSVLEAVLANILTQADCPLSQALGGTGSSSLAGAGILTTASYPTPIADGGTGASSFSAAGLVTFAQLENAPGVVIPSTSNPNTSSGTPGVIPEMSYTKIFSGRKVCMNFTCEVNNNNLSANTFFQFYKDASPIGPVFLASSPTGSQNETGQGIWFDLPSPGSHYYSVFWWVNAGTSTNPGTARSLQVTEI